MVIVIVIIAILAAVLVPSLITWIGKAQDKKDEEACRQVVQATQARIAELHGKGTEVTSEEAIEIAAEEAEKLGLDARVIQAELDEHGNLSHLNIILPRGVVGYCAAGGKDDCGMDSQYKAGLSVNIDLPSEPVTDEYGRTEEQARYTQVIDDFMTTYLKTGFRDRGTDASQALKEDGGYSHETYVSAPSDSQEFFSEHDWTLLQKRIYYTETGSYDYYKENNYNAKSPAYMYDPETKTYKYGIMTNSYGKLMNRDTDQWTEESYATPEEAKAAFERSQ